MYKSLFLILCVAVFQALAATSPFIQLDASLDSAWSDFKDVYQKTYETPELEQMRRAIWERNLHEIRTHNLEYDLGKHTYIQGMNKHGDLSHEEFRLQMNGYKKAANSDRRRNEFMAPEHIPSYPDSVDWRPEGYVTPIKDQKDCGSCWAFSATGSLEGQHYRKTKQLRSLSEQNLVDCSKKYGNNGCGGGLMDYAFEYIKANNGIDTEASYPYEARDSDCRFKRANVGATDTGFVDIPSGNETALLAAVATVGPISVAIDASHRSFHFYKKGVYNERECSSSQLDHGVLVVGYGTEGGKKYWIVKNSWGANWGEHGYIQMSRDNHNQCGIATAASYPLV